MKYIRKNHLREPRTLRIFKETTPNASFIGLPSDIKNAIREVLVEEQGCICAYCMGRITADSKLMEIEHYIPQNRYLTSPYSPEEHRIGQLSYMNMLGTCKSKRSCSGIRRNIPLTINPVCPNCETLIKFRKDGTVYSLDEAIENDIKTLELDRLSEARREVIDKARQEANARSQGTWSNDFIEEEIQRWKTLKSTRYGQAYEPYCMAAVHYLESKKSK